MESPDDISGGCACGAVRFVARGTPVRVGLCHCMTCRKAHGSAFNPFVVFLRDQVSLEGELQHWQSSAEYRRSFCPACGSRVAMSAMSGNEIELNLGSFDEIGMVRPQYESRIVRREPWLAALDVHQNLYDREPDAGGTG